MREIKFRAWDKRNKCFVGNSLYDYCISFDGSIGFINNNGNVDFNNDNEFYSDKLELMQFTGLKDKNGVEIYEGDVLELVYPAEIFDGVVEMEEQRYVGEVIFKDANFEVWRGKTYLDMVGNSNPPLAPDDNTLEVIGNIYEDPGLLDKNKGNKVEY